ncbi:MAG: peptide/nickel transport system substrate-binding protein [Microbacteriaceae bacterium]|nr:peptide/nickel transport system substrate-binding protein [Microbacteriaceae bacterium]
MNRIPARLAGVTALTVATALTITGCSAGGGSSSSSSGGTTKTLVVDNSFDLKTADPARAFELTGTIVDKALYETALTFSGSDVSKPLPQLTTFTESADNKTLTLTLRGKHTFASGNPVRIDDIVWSYKRVQAIAGNPVFLLQNADGSNLAIAKTSDTTMTLTSKSSNPQLPYILPNPSLGVLDEKLVEKHGGTATKDDKAESYLSGHSAGSGPYVISSYDVKSKVVFTSNPHYSGPKPTYGRVVLQNVAGPQQKINVQAGQAGVALDLNADQVKGLGTGSTKILKDTSPNVLYTWFNQNPAVGQGVTNKPDFVNAVRKGINYAEILSITGQGSVQPGGMVPVQFVGAIKPDAADATDTKAAIASLNKSGYKGQTVTFAYPSDITLNGISFQTLAQAIQSQLKGVGITLKLAPSPFSTFIDAYRAGKLQAGIMYWGPDFPDPADYTVFSPGESLGLRAGWAKTMAPNVTAAKEAALNAAGTEARATAYGTWQRLQNQYGPFIPVVQPGRYFVTTSAVKSVPSNAVWTVDLAAIK